MNKLLSAWYVRNFSHPDAIRLLGIIAVLLATLLLFLDIIMPIAISIVLAYLLDGISARLRNYGLPNYLSVILVLLGFLGLICVLSFLVLPILWEQLASLVRDIPDMITKGQQTVISTIEQYPSILPQDLITTIFANIQDEITVWGQFLVSFIVSSIPNIIGIVIYSVMIPLLIFFLLIDKDKILISVSDRYGDNSSIMAIGREINLKLGRFIKGKIIEIIIVAVISYIAFAILSLDYAMLLGFLVGLSVLVPFVGAIFVTIPIVVIALLQWGVSTEFIWVLSAYSIILFIDANILVPILFSEAVKMQPLAILFAIIVFGGLFGFWGVFFAIPLAVIIKAVVTMWPQAAVEG